MTKREPGEQLLWLAGCCEETTQRFVEKDSLRMEVFNVTRSTSLQRFHALKTSRPSASGNLISHPMFFSFKMNKI